MMNAKELLRQTESLLLQNDHITLAEASATQLHNALSTAAMNALTPLGSSAKRNGRRIGRRTTCRQNTSSAAWCTTTCSALGCWTT